MSLRVERFARHIVQYKNRFQPANIMALNQQKFFISSARCFAPVLAQQNRAFATSSPGRPPKWPPINPYELLNIKEPFTPKQLRQAYLEQVRKWHPDSPSNGEAPTSKNKERFQQIQDAFELLKSSSRRFELSTALKSMNYDQFLKTRLSGASSMWENAPASKPGQADYWYRQTHQQQGSNGEFRYGSPNYGHFGGEFRDHSQHDYSQWYQDPASYQQFYKPSESLTRTNSIILTVFLVILGGYNVGLYFYSRAKREQFDQMCLQIKKRRELEQLESGNPSSLTKEQEENAVFEEVRKEMSKKRLARLEQDAVRQSLSPSTPSTTGDRVMFAPGFFNRVQQMEEEKRTRRLEERRRLAADGSTPSPIDKVH